MEDGLGSVDWSDIKASCWEPQGSTAAEASVSVSKQTSVEHIHSMCRRNALAWCRTMRGPMTLEMRPTIDPLDPSFLQDVADGSVRLTPAQGLQLFHDLPLPELGRWADKRCRAIHGEHIRTYVMDRNINYTNVCTAKCTFCAFRRDLGADDAYTLSFEQIDEKITELTAIGGTQILMQGGMNPELPLEWYESLLGDIRKKHPGVHVHAFSPPEVVEFVNFFNPPGATFREKVHWVLSRLQAAGLQSIPGGGGEIFAQAVREKIGLGKCCAETWLTVMHVAHELGMNTSATMMFGHIDGVADRIHHMTLVRDWQDRALRDFEQHGGGRYMAFISWPFQRENTALGRVREWAPDTDGEFPGDVVAQLDGSGEKSMHREFGRRLRLSGASDYLRTQAISRLMLDNIYSIGASWVTMGPHVGQIALQFGANDMGSVMMEENVVSAAGTTYCMSEQVLCHLIRDTGFTPAQRDNSYDLLAVHDTAASPDLQVEDWSILRASPTQDSGEKLVSLTQS
jgi:cyclic dehypoxanthinyl futalosine synthase